MADVSRAKPPLPQVNWGHPQANGLRVALPFYWDNYITTSDMRVEVVSQYRMTVGGPIVRAAGQFGWCGRIASLGSMAFGNIPATNIALGSATIGVWVRTTTTSRMFLVEKTKHTSQFDGYWMDLNNSANGDMYFLCSSGGTNVFANFNDTALTNGKWHHLVYVVDRVANLSRIYMDGVQRTTSNIATVGTMTNTGTFILAETSFPSIPFIGDLDDFRFYNRLLSAKEIREWYSNPMGVYQLPDESVLLASAIAPPTPPPTGLAGQGLLLGVGM